MKIFWEMENDVRTDHSETEYKIRKGLNWLSVDCNGNLFVNMDTTGWVIS